MSPLTWYQGIRQQAGFIPDPSQAAAIEKLDVLWHELVQFKAKRNRWFGRSLFNPDVPQGLYLWGGVGRGKSFLMDVFYACVPYKRKRRIHFHNFMAEVHHQMQLLSSHKDPLIALAKQIEASTRLLCFDEFHVTDIADAMLLGRLMEALFKRGVVMIITSNSSPDELYPNGLQRQKFLPAIALIKRYLRVIHIDSGNDYRLRESPSAPLFMRADSESNSRMLAIFQRLSAGVTSDSQTIEIQAREIPVKQLATHMAWFEFQALCGGPRAQEDYLEIAHRFHTIFISDIPQLTAAEAAQAQRFIWLIDVLYDNRVKLVASSASTPEMLYSATDKTLDFNRTVSRLIEMQTQSYLELQHQTETQSL